ncbi:tyrosine-type recombinase/integrase [Mycobacterium terramassiliense]|uniref:tyrosine-type recombinase/integrase n=1 Tax=Mycobacterium terramassiliense TaxID=1841859 RepID=UPI00097D01CB|nr:site-specific integrase [Mycobacterium terramassiliense]
MTIRRREAKSGTRWDVEWLLPDGTKRSKTFKALRAAKLFDGEVRHAREGGEPVDPRGGKTELRVVYKSWLASRPDLSPKVRRGYEDNWRLRIEPKFGNWPIGGILRENVQEWVNEMTAAGLGPRTVRWTHTVLRMTLDHAITDKRLRGKNPASNVRFPAMGETSHVYLTAVEVAKLAELCDTTTGEDSRAAKQGDVVLMLAYTGLRFGELTGLNVEDVDVEARRIRVRRSITQLSGRLIEGPPKSRAGRRSVPIPERLVPTLKRRIEGRTAGEPAIMSPKGSRLGLENWKRAVGWRTQIVELGRPTMRVHDLRHTYASLARSAGADMKLLQVTMGHASIMVTAHTYADLYDSDLDRVANALDGLGA